MNERCGQIKKVLLGSTGPVTASRLAEMFNVSRQIIVNDVALLRASGSDIVATARGYVINPAPEDTFKYIGVIACKHSSDQLRDELYTIVDFGGTVIDVSIDHAIYGELSGKLDLSSRYQVDQFMEQVRSSSCSTPISTLTDGVHLHKIGCRSEELFNEIRSALISLGIALE